jgi:DnaK suppressor protein
MDAEQLEYFRKLLEGWLQDLLARAGDTVGSLREAADSLPDPLDRAIFETDRNFTLRIRDRESVLIKKIRKSIEDIEDGVYGICAQCGEEISIGRLKARPVARHCIKCKTLMETMERLTGT